jgi:hypothetical protein
VPPRSPAGNPQQWFVLRPWVFDVTFAGVLLRAAPRPPRMIPVAAWARAYGLVGDPGSGRHAISLIGPGPDFSPEYAMTTNPEEPVILATLTGPSGEPAGPLLIDGCHRLYKAARLGREQQPSFVLTAAETLAIRRDAVLGPAGRRSGGPAMVTVTVCHNVAADAQGRHIAMLDGYRPGHPHGPRLHLTGRPAGRSPEVIAEEAFAICNGHPRDAGGEDLSRRYYERGLRSRQFPRKLACCSHGSCYSGDGASR